MKTIIVRELRNYFQNPIYWLGLLLVVVMMYQMIHPYLQLHYFLSDQELEEIQAVNLSDADIMEGYMPNDREQQVQLWYAQIYGLLITEMEFSEMEAREVISELQGKEIGEADEYLREQYGFYNAHYMFEEFTYMKGNKEEVNSYIAANLQEHPYSYYFARKFADAGSLCIGFYAVIVLAFLFIRDTRRDTYELLHTKPVSPAGYIGGKAAGGFLALLFVLLILNVVFGALCLVHAGQSGFAVRLWDLPLFTLIYLMPNILMITSVFAAVSIVFKNPLPAVPLLGLYLIYSNMGSIGPDGKYGYYGKALAVIVRFPGRFFDTDLPSMVWMNQGALLAVSAVLLVLTAVVWKRRRVY